MASSGIEPGTPENLDEPSPEAAGGVIEHKECATAEELLECLSPHSRYWRPDPSIWVFRGHANADWKLLASAHRDKAFDSFVLPDKIRNSETEWVRCADSEKWLLKRFREGLGDIGQAIPTHVPTVDQGNKTSFPGSEPIRDLWPLRALAQHHGLPTALLDWTRRARNAAYFAAAEATMNWTNPGHLAVWALRIDLLRYATRDPREAEPIAHLDRCWLRLIQMPYADNPNMHAQAGVFTNTVGDYFLTVDDFVAKLAEAEKEQLEREPKLRTPFMRKFLLPKTEAPKLFRLLSYEGVTAATMFSGCDGVAKALREQTLWDEPPT